MLSPKYRNYVTRNKKLQSFRLFLSYFFQNKINYVNFKNKKKSYAALKTV